VTAHAAPEGRDWAHDYDVLDPDFVRDPYPVLRELRAKCPVAHTERWGGSWMPLRYEDVRAAASDFEHLSSADMYVIPPSPEELERSPVPLSFIQMAPPEHGPLRRMVLPFFAPGAVETWEPSTRALCRTLVDGIAGRERVDGMAEYAQLIPPRVTADLFGFDAARADEFVVWILAARELEDPAARAENALRVQALVREQIAYRRRQPGGDFISWLLSQREDGQPVPDDVVMATSLLMFSAGIRTVVSSIGIVLWHLAHVAADRRRLVDDPGLIPSAIEELMRAYSPVTMARVATQEVKLGDQVLQPGERVLLSFPAANRDPAVFTDPDDVVLDRRYNQHLAFGAGIHRCAGSNLARMQLRVSLGEWLARFPEFELEDGAAVTWVGGQVRGPRYLPLRITASQGR
jgi:cytochrome P450